MRKLFLFSILASLLLASCSNPDFSQEQISLVPKPSKFILKEQSFRFKSGTSIVIQDESQRKAANYLVGMLNRAAGFKLSPTEEKTGNGVLFETVEQLKKEAYHLEINPNQIIIQTSDEAGFFNAVQTIRQLLPPEIESKTQVQSEWLVPCSIVDDEPRFAWRGMHMDFSRHFSTIDEVKEFLDYMALYKLNTYHMHLTDDQGWRIEIKKYPLLTEKGAWRIENNQDTICNNRAIENELYKIDKANYREVDGLREYGGFFTQEQIKDIVKYADERCITVIPEIDMPGHFKSAIDNYPFLSCTGEAGWGTVFSTPTCLGKETTYEFMENILSEIVELFPCQYIHIGGDEVMIQSWQECPKCQKEIKTNHLADEHELQSHFNRRIEKFLQSKGKKLMGWDEIVTGGLTKDASVMWWRGWRPDAPKMAAENGNELVITTTDAYYFDYLNDHNSVEKVYNFEPVPVSFTPEQSKQIMGVQANLWSEWIPSFRRLQYQAFPRMLALAETAWTAKENKNVSDFSQRLEKQYDRMDVLGIWYYIPAVEGLSKKIVFVDSILMNLSYSHPGIDVFYTLDGSIPTRESTKYTEPFFIKKPGQIKARAYRGNVFNDLVTAEIEQQQYREAATITPENKGLKRWVIKNTFSNVDEIKLPVSAYWAKVDSIGMTEYAGQNNFAMFFSGYFNAETDGVYEFELKSDGGSQFYLGDEVIVDKSNSRGPFKKYAKVALKKGWHSVSVSYLPSKKPREISVLVTKPTGSPELLNNSTCAYEE